MAFFLCERCGVIISRVNSDGVRPSCCDGTMTMLRQKLSNLSNIKHVSIGAKDNNIIKLTIGSKEQS